MKKKSLTFILGGLLLALPVANASGRVQHASDFYVLPVGYDNCTGISRIPRTLSGKQVSIIAIHREDPGTATGLFQCRISASAFCSAEQSTDFFHITDQGLHRRVVIATTA